jgi:hypothetical protein
MWFTCFLVKADGFFASDEVKNISSSPLLRRKSMADFRVRKHNKFASRRAARRNPVARALRSPAARQQIVPSAARYRRHPKHRKAAMAGWE